MKCFVQAKNTVDKMVKGFQNCLKSKRWECFIRHQAEHLNLQNTSPVSRFFDLELFESTSTYTELIKTNKTRFQALRRPLTRRLVPIRTKIFKLMKEVKVSGSKLHQAWFYKYFCVNFKWQILILLQTRYYEFGGFSKYFPNENISRICVFCTSVYPYSRNRQRLVMNI